MSKIYLNPNAIKENTIPINKIVTVDLDGKQDIIDDLEDIRDGAAKGATALQSFAETDPIFSASPAASITNSDITNWNAKTSNTGTITGIKMNGVSKGTSGVVDLGDVITSLEGYATENYVTNAITNAKIEGGDGDPIDLSGYATKDNLNKKVDKVTGKGLSTNDFTDELKQKLEGLDEDIKGNVQSDWNATSGDAQILNKPQFATVATSGSYNDLTNKPTIPSAVTESTVSGWGFTKNTGTYSKPETGIPSSDLSKNVKDALKRAENSVVYSNGFGMCNGLQDIEDNKFLLPTSNMPELSGNECYTLAIRSDIENKYITDFTIHNLEAIAACPDEESSFDHESLINAIKNKQRILVPIGNGIEGFATLSGYVDDYLYAVIIHDHRIFYFENFYQEKEILNYSNVRVYDLDKSSNLIQNITWQNLKTLRDSGNLIPGMQYRIIDYVTTTAQAWTKSANHQFDIIVTADSKNTLNEKAKACLHEWDEYFKNSNLAAWQIWYCLDNDNERFNWISDETKTVDRIKIEFEDGGKVLVSRASVFDKEVDGINYYSWSYTYHNSGYHIYTDTLNVTSDSLIYDVSMQIKNDISFLIEQETVFKGKGVIYRMIDEYENDCPYDFKNIMFMRSFDDEGNLLVNGRTTLYEKNPKYLYTFTLIDSLTQEVIDASLSLSKRIDTYNIVCKNQILSHLPELCNIVMYDSDGAFVKNNCFKDCHDITIIKSCSGNQFEFSSDINMVNSDYNVFKTSGRLKSIDASLNNNVFNYVWDSEWNKSMEWTHISYSSIVNNMKFQRGLIEHCNNLVLNSNVTDRVLQGNHIFNVSYMSVLINSDYNLITKNDNVVTEMKISKLTTGISEEYVDNAINSAITNVLNTEV